MQHTIALVSAIWQHPTASAQRQMQHCLLCLQIRLIDLQKEAVRPYSNHASSISSILPLSSAVFMSGGSDGTVRCHDSRTNSRSSQWMQASNRHSLLGGASYVQQSLLRRNPVLAGSLQDCAGPACTVLHGLLCLLCPCVEYRCMLPKEHARTCACTCVLTAVTHFGTCCAVLLSAAVLCCYPAVDQRTEHAGHTGMRVAVHAMAQDPVNQQYIATGGGDAFGEYAGCADPLPVFAACTAARVLDTWQCWSNFASW